nr:MAG TPA: protein of unknown function (DUF5370) [Caudoviricetes sp.]
MQLFSKHKNAEIHVFPRFRRFLYYLLFVQKLTVPHIFVSTNLSQRNSNSHSGTLFKLCEIRQYGLRQPLQVQTTPVAADEADVSAVFGLQKRDGRRHFIRIRQGFGRQEGVVDGVEQQQRNGYRFEPRFARGAAVIVETVGEAVQRRGKRIVEVA